MRAQFCGALISRVQSSRIVFLTGDLGFMALEPLRDALGSWFINAGISEQNMLSVAAAMSKAGLEVWVYSIAPFCYARAFEQIRNDIALHRLPVKIVGNGGGYGYGVMGPTHHAIEDYGVVLTLTNLFTYIPAFDEDVVDAVNAVADNCRATYLRLGRGEAPKCFSIPPFAAWRRLLVGKGPIIVVVGPLVGTYLATYLHKSEENRPEIWSLSVLPVEHNPPPATFLKSLEMSGRLLIVEEHVRHGSAGSEIAMWLMERGIAPKRFRLLCAMADHFDHHGSQNYMRKRAQLDIESLQSALRCL